MSTSFYGRASSSVSDAANAISGVANSVSQRVQNINYQLVLREVLSVVSVGLALAVVVAVGVSLTHKGMSMRKVIPLSIITGLIYSVIIAMFDLFSSDVPINLRGFSGWVKAGIGLALGASVVSTVRFF